MGRLVELGQGEDSSAAGACEILGTLQFAVMKDFRGAETNLRRAVSLEPSRDQAWEVLLGVLAETERWEDLLQVSLDRVKHRNTARNWVLVVKAYERLRQDDNMLAEAQAAREKYPEDFYTNLTLAAAIMKTSENREELAQAGPHFTKAEQLLRGAPGRERLTNLIFLRGLHLGLSGQTEPARELFKKLLELDKDNSEAKEALQALE
jgi:tetratricopeptide (TPR) repeat protein